MDLTYSPKAIQGIRIPHLHFVGGTGTTAQVILRASACCNPNLICFQSVFPCFISGESVPIIILDCASGGQVWLEIEGCDRNVSSAMIYMVLLPSVGT